MKQELSMWRLANAQCWSAVPLWAWSLNANERRLMMTYDDYQLIQNVSVTRLTFPFDMHGSRSLILCIGMCGSEASNIIHIPWHHIPTTSCRPRSRSAPASRLASWRPDSPVFLAFHTTITMVKKGPTAQQWYWISQESSYSNPIIHSQGLDMFGYYIYIIYIYVIIYNHI